MSGYLWIGNGEQAWAETEFYYELSVSLDDGRKLSGGVLFNPAANMLTPVLANAEASKATRLV